MGMKFKDLIATIYDEENRRSIAENFHKKG